VVKNKKFLVYLTSLINILVLPSKTKEYGWKQTEQEMFHFYMVGITAVTESLCYE